MNEELDPMQDAIKVLTDRMEAYPEEFVKDGDVKEYSYDSDGSREYSRFWKVAHMIRRSMASDRSIADDPLWFLNDIERQQLYEAMREAMRQTFVTNVMTTLLAPEEDRKAMLKRAQREAGLQQMYPQGTMAAQNNSAVNALYTSQEILALQRQATQMRNEHALAHALAAQNIYGKYV
jgi:hypothetical protein